MNLNVPCNGTVYHTIMASLRTGSIVVCTNERCDGTFRRVGKAMAIVEREGHSMTLFRLHYNGQYYVIPTEQLRKATPEEKKRDKKSPSEWAQTPATLNLSRVYKVNRPTTCAPYVF